MAPASRSRRPTTASRSSSPSLKTASPRSSRRRARARASSPCARRRRAARRDLDADLAGLGEHRHPLAAELGVGRRDALLDLGLGHAGDLEHGDLGAVAAAARREPRLHLLGEHRLELARRARQQEDRRAALLEALARAPCRAGWASSSAPSSRCAWRALTSGMRRPRRRNFSSMSATTAGSKTSARPQAPRHRLARDVVGGGAEAAADEHQLVARRAARAAPSRGRLRRRRRRPCGAARRRGGAAARWRAARWCRDDRCRAAREPTAIHAARIASDHIGTPGAAAERYGQRFRLTLRRCLARLPASRRDAGR